MRTDEDYYWPRTMGTVITACRHCEKSFVLTTDPGDLTHMCNGVLVEDHREFDDEEGVSACSP